LQLGDAQFHRAGALLPGAVAVAVALNQPRRALLALAGASQRSDFKLHHSFRRKADHLAQEIGVRGLLESMRRFIISSVIARSSVAVAFATQPYR
jgi:hypothetical protein